jgi:hypothetical protein
MSLAQAKSGSKNESRRTNSLAFAKQDCHTCAALETQCDRKRPHCGTCLSNQRKCDGFAIPLVWKDLEVAQSLPPSRDKRSSQSQNRGIRGNAEFKFVRGRPKRKRKPKGGNLAEAAYHQGCFPLNIVYPEIPVQENHSTFIDSSQNGPNTSYGELENAYSRLSIVMRSLNMFTFFLTSI